MTNNIMYNGHGKKFKVPKKKKKFKKGAQLFFASILLVASILSSLVLVLNSVNFGETLHTVNYDSTLTSDYKVNLKENDHYQSSYLGPGLEYISSLINTISIDFDYLMTANEILTYDYKYKISADLIITNNNEPDQVIFSENYILREDSVNASTSSINVDEEIEIDFVYYNEYVNNYKKEFGLLVDSNLVVTFEVITNGTSEVIDNKIDDSKKSVITIPLSEQTISIINPLVAPESGYLADVAITKISNYILFSVSILFGILSLLIIIYIVTLLYKITSNKDIYKSVINKYLREYDRLIVTTNQPDINESNFENKIRVMSIEELIDAHDATGSPIIYYEVVPDEKSYFILMSSNTLYKLTISRVYLEEEKRNKKRN